VVVCGEVKVVLVFDLVVVAEASVQLEQLSVASWSTSAQSDHLSEVEEVFLAHVLRLLLSSFFFASEGLRLCTHPWNMCDAGLRPLADLVYGGSYKSSCDPPNGGWLMAAGIS
jgi:hypothetical protein